MCMQRDTLTSPRVSLPRPILQKEALSAALDACLVTEEEVGLLQGGKSMHMRCHCCSHQLLSLGAHVRPVA